MLFINTNKKGDNGNFHFMRTAKLESFNKFYLHFDE